MNRSLISVVVWLISFMTGAITIAVIEILGLFVYDASMPSSQSAQELFAYLKQMPLWVFLSVPFAWAAGMFLATFLSIVLNVVWGAGKPRHEYILVAPIIFFITSIFNFNSMPISLWLISLLVIVASFLLAYSLGNQFYYHRQKKQIASVWHSR